MHCIVNDAEVLPMRTLAHFQKSPATKKIEFFSLKGNFFRKDIKKIGRIKQIKIILRWNLQLSTKSWDRLLDFFVKREEKLKMLQFLQSIMDASFSLPRKPQ